MSTYTSNFGFVLPSVNSPQDADLWGGELNATISEQDALFLTSLNFVTSAPTTSFSVVSPTTGSGATGSSHEAFLCNANSGAIVVTLPAASSTGNGCTVAFKKTDSSGNAVTLTASGSDTIDGLGTFSLTAQYSWAIIVSDGSSKWNIFSDTVSTAGLAPLNSPAFTGVPTAPTPSLSDSSTQIATTAFVSPGSSIGTNGYQTFPSGCIIQWGSRGSGSSFGTIGFPLAFPNACFSVTTSMTSSGSVIESCLVTSISATGFNFNNLYINSNAVPGGAAGDGFYWIAIGN